VSTPRCFGRYVLIERIAAGGMGEVYIAVPRSLWGIEKFFAIKKVLPTLSCDPEFLTRFRDEARLVIPMNHPNVVQVFEVGRVDEEYFIAMELVEGRNLGQLMTRSRQRPLPIAAALYIVRELLAGLEYCHRRTDEAGCQLGMVHRDVSPSNVLVSFDGAIKLADFGLALSKHKTFQTKPSLVLGHLGYIAPEALEGKRQDQRSDIFSAGVLLYELLSGERFTTGTDPFLVRQQLRSHARIRPSVYRPGISRAADLACLRALSPNPEDRFQSARSFHDEVQRALVQADPLYGARQLAERVLQDLFEVEAEQRELRALVHSLDLEELEAAQPAGRTVCIGEAIPLQPPLSKRRPFGDGTALLTMLDDLSEGDTQPQALRSGSSRQHQVQAAASRPHGGSPPRAARDDLLGSRARRRRSWHTPPPSLRPAGRQPAAVSLSGPIVVPIKEVKTPPKR